MRFLLLMFFVLCVAGCAASRNPEAAEINARLGLEYLGQHEVPLAKQKLLLALTQDANSPAVNDAFAYFLEKTDKPEMAEDYYWRAIKYGKDSGTALNNYGTYLYRQKRYHEALQYFLLATKDIKYLNVAGAYENAGFAALKLHDKKSAQNYFHLALQTDASITKGNRKFSCLYQ
jgi:type IV pilus assembly protein PilF